MNDKNSLLFGQPIFPNAYLASPVARDSGLATIANLPQVPNLREVRPDFLPKTFLPRSVEEPTELVFDMGREEVGYLTLSLSGAGCEIKCFYGESWQEAIGRDFPHFEHWESRMQTDEVHLKPGKTSWQSPDRRAFRYCRLRIIPNTKPVTIETIALQPYGHPVQLRGKFECSDEWVNKMWEVGVHTVRLCMQEVYEDGVRRDRMAWIFDAQVEALVNYYAFGDRELFATTWRHFAAKQSDDGMIDSLWDYGCWWVIALHDYYLHTADLNLVREFYPNGVAGMGWFLARRDNLGLLSKDGRQEVFGGGEAIFYKALSDLAALASPLGRSADAERYLGAVDELKDAINQHLWDPTLGVYNDRRPPHINIGHRANFTCVDESLNAFALLFGIADQNRALKVGKYLQENLWSPYGSFPHERPRNPDRTYATADRQQGSPVHDDCIWPVMNFYQVEGYFHWNMPQAWELLQKCWGNLLDQGATTYWECVHQDGTIPALWTSLCHGWSAGVSYSLPASVVGIKPLSPGFATFEIHPHLGPLEWARATVPTPYGAISALVRREGDQMKVESVDAPPECRWVKTGD
jgi:hypothetical protein